MASTAIADGIDVAALRLFQSVVELGSVSKAARRHRLAQPSATAKLHKLERQLGVQLLERGPSGSTATQQGAALASNCADVIAAVVALVDRSEELREARPRLTVATTRHVADHFLPGWFTGCGLDGVRVDLVEADTLTVTQTVRAGEAALGFTEGPAAPLGLRSELVAHEEVVPVVGRAHRWYRRRRRLTGADLVSATLVLGQRGSGTRDVVESAISEHGFGDAAAYLEVASSAAARLAAMCGHGVAFLPRCRLAADLRTGDLRVLPVADLRITQPVRVVWRGARPTEPSARELLDHLRRDSPHRRLGGISPT